MVQFGTTTRGEIARMTRLRDAVGGYAELGRLLREKEQSGPTSELARGPDGRLTYTTVREEK